MAETSIVAHLENENYIHKIDQLKEYLALEVSKIVDHAAREGSLDYFKVEISNHLGSVQLDYFFRERSKVY